MGAAASQPVCKPTTLQIAPKGANTKAQKSSSSAAKPSTSAAKTSTSAAKTSTSAAKTSTSAAKPSTSAAKTSSTVKKPEDRVKKPSTSELTSTSSGVKRTSSDVKRTTSSQPSSAKKATSTDEKGDRKSPKPKDTDSDAEARKITKKALAKMNESPVIIANRSQLFIGSDPRSGQSCLSMSPSSMYAGGSMVRAPLSAVMNSLYNSRLAPSAMMMQSHLHRGGPGMGSFGSLAAAMSGYGLDNYIPYPGAPVGSLYNGRVISGPSIMAVSSHGPFGVSSAPASFYGSLGPGMGWREPTALYRTASGQIVAPELQPAGGGGSFVWSGAGPTGPVMQNTSFADMRPIYGQPGGVNAMSSIYAANPNGSFAAMPTMSRNGSFATMPVMPAANPNGNLAAGPAPPVMNRTNSLGSMTAMSRNGSFSGPPRVDRAGSFTATRLSGPAPHQSSLYSPSTLGGRPTSASSGRSGEIPRVSSASSSPGLQRRGSSPNRISAQTQRMSDRWYSSSSPHQSSSGHRPSSSSQPLQRSSSSSSSGTHRPSSRNSLSSSDSGSSLPRRVSFLDGKNPQPMRQRTPPAANSARYGAAERERNGYLAAGADRDNMGWRALPRRQG